MPKPDHIMSRMSITICVRLELHGDSSMSLTEARRCYELALKLKSVPDVIAQTQHGIRLLDGIGGPEADDLRLALLDLELQAQSGETYLPPSPATVAQFAALSQSANSPLYRARAL